MALVTENNWYQRRNNCTNELKRLGHERISTKFGTFSAIVVDIHPDDNHTNRVTTTDTALKSLKNEFLTHCPVPL